jgi:hypothetical protein
MRARQVITRALRLLKVIAANEAGDAADLDVGLIALNEMIGSWSLERNLVLASVIETFPATGALSYTIGIGGNFNTAAPISLPIVEYTLNGVDYPMIEWTEEQYASIGIKSLTGQALGYWFVKGAPLAKMYVANVPGSGSFKLHSIKEMTEFADLDTDYDLAPGYVNALTFSLAVDMAPEFEAEASKTVLLRSMNLKRSLKRSNAVVPVMDSGVPLNPYRYGYRG